MGLITIDHAQFAELHNAKVLLRAHGEPPETYKIAEQNNIEIIDATCPVVLQLQKRIKKQFTANPDAQIVIFGKNGHAEVLGLVGQTRQRAIVIEHADEVTRLDFTHDIYLYSQTTKSLDEFHTIIDYIQGAYDKADGIIITRNRNIARIFFMDTSLFILNSSLPALLLTPDRLLSANVSRLLQSLPRCCR